MCVATCNGGDVLQITFTRAPGWQGDVGLQQGGCVHGVSPRAVPRHVDIARAGQQDGVVLARGHRRHRDARGQVHWLRRVLRPRKTPQSELATGVGTPRPSLSVVCDGHAVAGPCARDGDDPGNWLISEGHKDWGVSMLEVRPAQTPVCVAAPAIYSTTHCQKEDTPVADRHVCNLHATWDRDRAGGAQELPERRINTPHPQLPVVCDGTEHVQSCDQLHDSPGDGHRPAAAITQADHFASPQQRIHL
mmetsp:Transcript_17236/g.30728  ORF Transcript_17236/g.30728 Transcript_17236/m.30728 type:complete len:248 (+) Transcript_17236:592-1335(+)